VFEDFHFMKESENMKKLLFITPELPFPLQSGGKVKSMKLLQSLAERYDVTLVSPLKQDDAKYLDAFHSISPCSQHFHVELNVARSPYQLVASYLQGKPLNVRRTFSSGLNQKISKLVSQHDIVFLDHYEVFPYLPDDYSGTVVYHAHNAYYKMWERYASLPGNPAFRCVARLEAWRVKTYESSVAQRANLVFAAPNDARELVEMDVAPDKIHDTYHLGDDSQLALPELRFQDTKKCLMYVGYLGWEPNVQGLLWFIREVWPRLQKKHPDLGFSIVGKNPDERLTSAVASCSGITLKGFVSDLQEIYQQSRVSVAPLLFGSGMKVKVLDAMSRGLPTVTTTIGAEGIDVVNGSHLFVEDEPVSMCECIDELLINQHLWQRMQHHSRALVREKYNWNSMFRKMHRILDQTLADSNQPLKEDSENMVPYGG
jgi:glycosyltransferase involved in cell wall biosynthesis